MTLPPQQTPAPTKLRNGVPLTAAQRCTLCSRCTTVCDPTCSFCHRDEPTPPTPVEGETPLTVVVQAAESYAEYGGCDHEGAVKIKQAIGALGASPEDVALLQRLRRSVAAASSDDRGYTGFVSIHHSEMQRLLDLASRATRGAGAEPCPHCSRVHPAVIGQYEGLDACVMATMTATSEFLADMRAPVDPLRIARTAYARALTDAQLCDAAEAERRAVRMCPEVCDG